MLSVVLLSLAAGGLHAEDAPWLFTGNNEAGDSDLTVAKWSNDGGTTKEAPQTGRSYSVTGKKQCGYTLANGDLTFAGDVLSIGDGSSDSRLTAKGSQKSAVWTFPSLVFKDKGGLSVSYNNGTLTLAGSVTFSDGEAVIFDNGGYKTALDITASLHGSGDFRIWKNKSNSYFVSYRLLGDASDYTGTMTVGRDRVYGSTYLTRVFLGDKAPRKVAVSPCGVLAVCGAEDYLGVADLDSLTLLADSALSVKVTVETNSLFRVKNVLALPAEDVVRLDLTLPAENAAVRRVPVLSAPTGSGLSEDRFVLTASSKENACRSAACSLEVEPDGEGYDVLYLVMEKYTYAVKDDSYITDVGQSSCWLKEYFNHWKTAPAGDALDSDCVYLCYDKDQTPPQQTATVTFAGKRWVLCSGNSKLTIRNGTQVIDDLVLLDNVPVKVASSGSVVDGHIRLAAPQGGEWGTEFQCSGGWSGTFKSSIAGDVGLSISGTGKAYSLNLTGVNSGLSGKVKVSTAANNPATNMTIVVTNACALGGAMAQFAYDGVMLEKWSQLRVTGSTSFDEPTRGLFISGAAIVDVQNADDEFALASQTTLAGELVKKGKGTLVLGGALKFTADQLATPLDGTNVLTVSAGRIRPDSKDGANGLAITFAAKTGLRFAPLAETDADVAKYGLYDVAWPTPFDLTATDGKLDVAVDVPEGAKDSFSFGICTVAEDAADALDGNIIIPEIKGLKATVVREPAVNNAVTFRADYERRGFMLIFR